MKHLETHVTVGIPLQSIDPCPWMVIAHQTWPRDQVALVLPAARVPCVGGTGSLIHASAVNIQGVEENSKAVGLSVCKADCLGTMR